MKSPKLTDGPAAAASAAWLNSHTPRLPFPRCLKPEERALFTPLILVDLGMRAQRALCAGGQRRDAPPRPLNVVLVIQSPNCAQLLVYALGRGQIYAGHALGKVASRDGPPLQDHILDYDALPAGCPRSSPHKTAK